MAREVLDSRGMPTLEVDVYTNSGALGRAMVPSGTSIGRHEVVELRDENPERYGGKGVQKAIQNITEYMAPPLVGQRVGAQEVIDRLLRDLDGTPNKKNLGGNALLAVSLAVAKASAATQGIPFYGLFGKNPHVLPVPLMNILNGGRHADNSVDIQEFMIAPILANSFSHALRMGVEVFQSLRAALKSRGHSTNVGDEGGFAPQLSGDEEAIQLVLAAIEKAGYVPGEDIHLALDIAASELYDPEKKCYTFPHTKRSFDAAEIVGFWETWITKYPIFSLEDPLAEDDWEGWEFLTKKLGQRVQLVGDDLFATNVARFEEGVRRGVGNAVLVKPNQIGTLSETLEVMEVARKQGYQLVVSHRSGETEDTLIADLAVGTHAGQIKAGAPCRTDRVAKYNQLLRIEEQLGTKAIFFGQAIAKRYQLNNGQST